MLMRKRLSFLTLCTLCVTALPAWAETAAQSDGQLPQFRTEYYPGQIVWLALTFGLLYIALKYGALPRIARTQEKRHNRRAADLTAAAEANDRAKQIVSDYEKSLATARQQARQKLDDIAKAEQSQSAQQQAWQQKALQDQLAEAEKNIAAMRTQALGHVRDAAIDVAQVIVHRLTGLETNATAAVDQLKHKAG